MKAIKLIFIAIICSCNNESGSNQLSPESSNISAHDTSQSKPEDTLSPISVGITKKDTNTTKDVVRLKSASIRVKCDGGGEGIDHNSKVEFQVQHPQYSMVTEYTINREVADDAIFEEPMRVADNRISKSELDNTVLTVMITAVGRDGHTGTPSVTFVFDDGTIITKKYKKYVIGTFHRSHITTQPVVP